MANIVIAPGYGSAYLSEAFTGTANGADILDLSHCGAFAIQVEQNAASTGTVKVQTTLNAGAASPKWADLGVALDVSTDGATSRFPLTSGPFGACRLVSAV